jgi:C_GCAxxG_C_C family probable redox protein
MTSKQKDIELKVEIAIRSFNADLNCAQSVMTAYMEEFNIDPEIALSVSCGFGGGMGRLQETCGAVTGAFMVLGIHNCKKYTDNKDRKEKTYAMIQEFSDKFKSLHGTMDCRLLLNCDLRTEEGQRYVKENKLHETICEKCVSDSIRLIEELVTPGSL